MKYKAILFDFDGVIVDSGTDIAAAVNSTLVHFGYETLPDALLISFVGNGTRTLLSRALENLGVNATDMQATNVQNADFDTFFVWYIAWYETHSVVKTVLYKGILPLLEALRTQNTVLAIVSNKPVAITSVILEYFSLIDFFDAVIGPEQLTHIKPHPEALALAVQCIEKKRTIQIDPSAVLMVGDSASDIVAGKAYGCKTCAVTAGLGSKDALLAENADIVVNLAGELLHLLEI